MKKARCTAALLALVMAPPAPAAPPAPKPALLVLNKIDATMVVVDAAPGQVLGKVATGEGPHEIVTDGTLAFVGNYGAQTPGAPCRSSISRR